MLGSAHQNGFRGHGRELSFAQISDVNRAFVLDDGDDCGVAQHALLVFWKQDFDELVRDAAKTSGQDGALAVAADEEILGVVKADIRGSVWSGGAPVGRAKHVPPLLDLRRVAGSKFREGQGVQFVHALLNFHFQNVFAKFQEAGHDFLWSKEAG